MGAKRETPRIVYDYERQAWLRLDAIQPGGPTRWMVLPCIHPEPTPGCYACRHMNQMVTFDEGK